MSDSQNIQDDEVNNDEAEAKAKAEIDKFAKLIENYEGPAFAPA